MEALKVRHWVEHFVLKHNLCPFAHKPFKDNQIEYTVLDSTEQMDVLIHLINTCQHLQTSPVPQTVLLILKQGFEDFDVYLELVDMAEELLIIENLSCEFQLASFHPEYRFEGTAHSDPANLTNRSPFPIVHILRCADVEQALKQHRDTLDIPKRNIELLRSLFGS